MCSAVRTWNTSAQHLTMKDWMYFYFDSLFCTVPKSTQVFSFPRTKWAPASCLRTCRSFKKMIQCHVWKRKKLLWLRVNIQSMDKQFTSWYFLKFFSHWQIWPPLAEAATAASLWKEQALGLPSLPDRPNDTCYIPRKEILCRTGSRRHGPNCFLIWNIESGHSRSLKQPELFCRNSRTGHSGWGYSVKF